ncbi:MAG: hypothetical protein ACTSYG_07335 [Candidatus Heimdallarchaeota archaeon]
MTNKKMTVMMVHKATVAAAYQYSAVKTQYRKAAQATVEIMPNQVSCFVIFPPWNKALVLP